MKKGLIVFVSAAAAAWVVLVSSVVLLLAGVASSASDEFVIGYQRAADLMNGSWQAILAFDTVRYDNDLDLADPNLSALEFFIIDYKEYVWVPPSGKGQNRVPGHWRLFKNGTLDTSEKIRKYF